MLFSNLQWINFNQAANELLELKTCRNSEVDCRLISECIMKKERMQISELEKINEVIQMQFEFDGMREFKLNEWWIN